MWICLNFIDKNQCVFFLLHPLSRKHTDPVSYTHLDVYKRQVLVFMSGYLFIYNTLYISVNRDIRYLGQLKTIGTTSIQIRKMIYKQMLWNSTIGIPLGLVCSAIVGKIIIPQLLHSLNRVAQDLKQAYWMKKVIYASRSFLLEKMTMTQDFGSTFLTC